MDPVALFHENEVRQQQQYQENMDVPMVLVHENEEVEQHPFGIGKSNIHLPKLSSPNETDGEAAQMTKQNIQQQSQQEDNNVVDDDNETDGEAAQLTKQNIQEQSGQEDNADDDEFWPLSGKPHFDIILHPSHIKPHYHLFLPAKLHNVLPSAIVPVVIKYRGKKWEVTYNGEGYQKRLTRGWRNFVIDNDLKEGDALVFEMLHSSNMKLEFRVQILRGDFPAELLEKVDGSSFATPFPLD